MNKQNSAFTSPRLRHLSCSLAFIAAIATAVGAVASPHVRQGLAGARYALPATTIVVINTNDSGPGSLRNALAVANDGDMIDATGISGTILLTSGELQINHNVTINGPGAENLAVNGNATSRIFENFASNVNISGFTITNGSDGNGGGGIFNHFNLHQGALTVSDSTIVSNAGGGIVNEGTVIVASSVISGNSAPQGWGGGIYNGGTLTVMNSVINDNSAPQSWGGGIFNYAAHRTATVTVTSSVISGNSASSGGGIATEGDSGDAAVRVSNCTISGNSSTGSGGGISSWAFSFENEGTSIVMVSNSTLSGNSAAGDGGAIDNAGGYHGSASLLVNNSTISGNSATSGISNYADFPRGGATLDLTSTILNAGASGANIYNNSGTVTSHGYNVSSDDGGGFLTGNGDQINTDPLLGPLQDNGGATFTQALLPGSPAIDAGDPTFTPPPFFDQRGPGYNRVVNGRIDIGSFEVQIPRISPTPRPRLTPRPRS